MFNKKHLLRGVLVPVAVISLAACSDNDSGSNTRTYEISISNLSANQPMSPVAAILHQPGYNAWQLSEAASAGLEIMAEGGDNSQLLSEAQSNTSHYLSSTSSDGILAPGHNALLTASTNHIGTIELTLATMLVNTNDAFTGISGFNLTAMSVGEALQARLPVYDAGTERNTELAGTIPGPADGGEGFNAIRDDIADQVTRHSGVVGAMIDGGLNENSLSALDESHRFDAPIASIIVTRTN